MTSTAKPLRETHTFGPGNKLWAVRVNDADQRPFLATSPICPGLSRYRIAHLGVQDAAHPYRIVRMNQSGTFFLACFGGEGRVLADGRWQRVRTGTGCLLLPHMLNAFHAVEGHRWQFCWIRFQESATHPPFVSASSPRVARFDARPLREAILGLHYESLGGAAPETVHHWIELVHDYVERFARPWQTDERLSQVWEEVAAHLPNAWTVERLAKLAHVSAEHLRRLCQRHLGRSPMHQVTFLRMKRAAQLLAETNFKIEHIAAEVGYQNPFVFSTAFKKWTGWRPSDYPGRRGRRSGA